MDRKKSTAGFSLIEMSFIIIIFGLIVGTIVPLLVSKIQQDKVREARDIVRMVRDEIIGNIVVKESICELPGQTISTRIDPWGNRVIYQIVEDEGRITIEDIDIEQVVTFYVLSTGKNSTLDANNGTHVFYGYGEISPVSGRPFDDIYEYVTESYIKSILSCETIDNPSDNEEHENGETDNGDGNMQGCKVRAGVNCKELDDGWKCEEYAGLGAQEVCKSWVRE